MGTLLSQGDSPKGPSPLPPGPVKTQEVPRTPGLRDHQVTLLLDLRHWECGPKRKVFPESTETIVILLRPHTLTVPVNSTRRRRGSKTDSDLHCHGPTPFSGGTPYVRAPTGWQDRLDRHGETEYGRVEGRGPALTHRPGRGPEVHQQEPTSPLPTRSRTRPQSAPVPPQTHRGTPPRAIRTARV